MALCPAGPEQPPLNIPPHQTAQQTHCRAWKVLESRGWAQRQKLRPPPEPWTTSGFGAYLSLSSNFSPSLALPTMGELGAVCEMSPERTS